MDIKQDNSRLKIFLFFAFCCIVLLACCFSCWFFTYLISRSPNSSYTDSLINNTSSLEYSHSYGDSQSNNKLLSISISGVIMDTRPENDFLTSLISGDVTYGYEVKEQLKKVALDNSISGVILEISSPGGTIAGAKAISDGVVYYRNTTGKPIISHIVGMAASGAYWSAVSTDNIIADTGSLTGSIGVILGPFEEYNKVLSSNGITTENGINEFYITGGGSKDVGNPFRKMTDEEKNSLQIGINNEYDIFVNFVSSRRNIPQTTIKETIKAMIYDNKRAQELKLIDSTGTVDDAYNFLAEKAGFANDYQIVKILRATDFWSNLFAEFLGKTYLASSVSHVTCQNLCYKPVALYGDPVKLDP